jgi:anti-anti-sigma factor
MSDQTPDLHVTFEQINDVTIARFDTYEISSLASIDQPLQQFKEEIQTRQPKKLIVDFTGVSFVATSAINMLLVILKRVRSYEGDVCLCGLSRTVRNVFEIMQLTRIFEVYPDRYAAMARISQA